MELNIGKRLRQLRRERELTQEELAAHLGISFQAVSKWERGEGYPDITILPVIAKYFSVTVDSLLCVDEDKLREKYESINRTWEENRTADRHTENIVLMRQALTEFPNDPLLMVQLAASLERRAKQVSSEDEKRECIRQSVEVQEDILRYCDDCEVRGATMYNICFSYEKLGKHEKALAQARKLPNLYKGRENALVMLAEDAEKKNISKAAIAPLVWSIELHLTTLAGEGEENLRRIAEIKRLMNEVI